MFINNLVKWRLFVCLLCMIPKSFRDVETITWNNAPERTNLFFLSPMLKAIYWRIHLVCSGLEIGDTCDVFAATPGFPDEKLIDQIFPLVSVNFICLRLHISFALTHFLPSLWLPIFSYRPSINFKDAQLSATNRDTLHPWPVAHRPQTTGLFLTYF